VFSARRRPADERGFTLIELLVVVSIIGILAAIAYAAFIGQRTKANDAAAKDAAAALGVDVQSCFTENDVYSACKTKAQINDNALSYDGSVTAGSDCTVDPVSGFSGKPDNGKVAVLAADTDCYLLAARSTDGTLFWITRTNGSVATRGCAPPGQGGCAPDGTWNRG
jgi:prepilin-type N-terminal cleavage/methylation domain-containing protein